MRLPPTSVSVTSVRRAALFLLRRGGPRCTVESVRCSHSSEVSTVSRTSLGGRGGRVGSRFWLYVYHGADRSTCMCGERPSRKESRERGAFAQLSDVRYKTPAPGPSTRLLRPCIVLSPARLAPSRARACSSSAPQRATDLGQTHCACACESAPDVCSAGGHGALTYNLHAVRVQALSHSAHRNR